MSELLKIFGGPKNRKFSISKFFIFIQMSMQIFEIFGIENFRNFSISKFFHFHTNFPISKFSNDNFIIAPDFLLINRSWNSKKKNLSQSCGSLVENASEDFFKYIFGTAKASYELISKDIRSSFVKSH